MEPKQQRLNLNVYQINASQLKIIRARVGEIIELV